MTAFPSSPVPPAELLEKWLPQAFEEADLPEDVRTSDVRLGLVLEGQGGGEWVLSVESGKLRVMWMSWRWMPAPTRKGASRVA